MEFDDKITKNDFYAIAISLVLAFFVGLIGGEDSFGIMVAVCLPTYCGIRYLQTRGML